MSRRSLLSATALASLLALPAQADQVTLLDLLNLNRLANIGGQLAIGALRGVADVTYAHMDIRPLDGRMVLTGLEVTPYSAPDCQIQMDRAVISGAPLDQIAYSALDVDVLGITVAQGCFSGSEQRDLADLGITDLELARGELRLRYEHSNAGLTVDLQAVSVDLAEIRGHIAFDYFAVDFDREEPVADLAYAEFEVTDRGIWPVLAAQIPPAMLAPEVLVPMMVGDLLPDWVDPGATTPAPVEPPTQDDKGDEDSTAPSPAAPANIAEDEAAYAFIEASAQTFARFAASPGSLRLEFAPEMPVRLDDDLFEEFSRFVAVLSPALMMQEDRPDTRVTAAEAEMLQDWINGGGVEVSDADLLRYANAFLTGIGAPRNAEIAIQLLTPLLETGNDQALDMALGTLDALDPGFAYDIARDLAAQGDRVAFAHLDRLEALLDMGDVIELQEAAPANPAYTGSESAAELREMAFASLTGLGAPRRYSFAYFYGLLALASGDAGAASIVDEVEAMGTRMTDLNADRWSDFLDNVRSEANDIWFARPAVPEDSAPVND